MDDRHWIIFDFDGTIANTLEVGVVVVNSLAGTFGYKQVSAEDVKRLRNAAPRQILKEVGISLWKLPFIARAVRKRLAGHMDEVEFYPGVAEALDQLKDKGYGLAILTTGSLDNARSFLRRQTHEGSFEFIYAESNLFGKARVLDRLMKRYNIAPSSVIYVGDEIRDIEAARAAGVKIAAVTWGVNSHEALELNHPDILIDHPEQLSGIVL